MKTWTALCRAMIVVLFSTALQAQVEQDIPEYLKEARRDVKRADVIREWSRYDRMLRQARIPYRIDPDSAKEEPLPVDAVGKFLAGDPVQAWTWIVQLNETSEEGNVSSFPGVRFDLSRPGWFIHCEIGKKGNVIVFYGHVLGQGPPGLPGATGATGQKGQDGQNGQDGASGQNGQDGRPGATGAPGQAQAAGQSQEQRQITVVNVSVSNGSGFAFTSSGPSSVTASGVTSSNRNLGGIGLAVAFVPRSKGEPGKPGAPGEPGPPGGQGPPGEPGKPCEPVKPVPGEPCPPEGGPPTTGPPPGTGPTTPKPGMEKNSGGAQGADPISPIVNTPGTTAPKPGSTTPAAAPGSNGANGAPPVSGPRSRSKK